MDAQARIDSLRQLAGEVLEDEESADRWLRSKIKALGMARPIDVAETIEGYDLCQTILHRLEYGVYG